MLAQQFFQFNVFFKRNGLFIYSIKRSQKKKSLKIALELVKKIKLEPYKPGVS